MKNITLTIFILLIIVVLGLYLISFQVRETQSALVTTFGGAPREITTPGWYFKWPGPIQRVYKFESRLMGYEADIGETPTKGAVPIIVNTYVLWRIVHPLDFFNAVGTVEEAGRKIYSQLSDTQNRVIGRHSFGEFVNSDKSKIKFKSIEDEMLTELRKAVSEDYGIEIEALGIKQLKINKDVSQDVFARMRAERNRRTLAAIAQGDAQATKIRTNADAKKTELLAAAQARAKAIRGAGDAEAAQYYKLLDKDPALAMFLRDIETLKKTLKERATVVISADTEPFKLLREMPDIKPADPNEVEN
ncbi:protease modulator HflC [Planctomycetota bacterium]